MKISRAHMFALITVLALVATDAGAALADLQAVYRKKLADIDAEASKRKESYKKYYVRKLDQIETAETRSGDLDAVLVLREEKKRFQKELIISEGVLVREPYALRKLQAAYLKALSDLPGLRARQILELAGKYEAALKRLQVKLTQKDEIEHALAVKAERDTLPNRPEIKKARSLVAQPKPAGEAAADSDTAIASYARAPGQRESASVVRKGRRNVATSVLVSKETSQKSQHISGKTVSAPAVVDERKTEEIPRKQAMKYSARNEKLLMQADEAEVKNDGMLATQKEESTERPGAGPDFGDAFGNGGAAWDADLDLLIEDALER